MGAMKAWKGIAHVELMAQQQREAVDAGDRLKALQLSDSDATGAHALLACPPARPPP